MKKRILAFALASIMAFSSFALFGCGDISSLEGLISGLEGWAEGLESVADDMSKQEEARKGLTNYKIVLESTSEKGDKSTVTEARTELGYVFSAENSIVYVEYGTGNMLMLNANDKTGISRPIENESIYRDFGSAITVHLYAFEVFKLLGAVKGGNEKISGRQTTKYTYNLEGKECEFWIDDEYGFTLKSIVKDESGETAMEVKDFKIGNVKLEDEVNLGDYAIETIESMFP
jgi:hypothetical protein